MKLAADWLRGALTCNQGWLSVLSTLYLFLIFTCSRLLIRSIAARRGRNREEEKRRKW